VTTWTGRLDVHTPGGNEFARGMSVAFPPRGYRHECHTAPVTNKRLGIVVAVLVCDAALLLIVGAVMWSAAPSSADEAVGKGLTVLGAALGIPAFLLLCAFLSSWADAALAREATRDDWETV
jgi:hypothetical protein